MRSDARLILMLGPSMDYPGGMTEVIRAYSAAGVFEAWPLRYISTYAGRDFAAKLRPWLSAVCSVLIGLARRRVALVHVRSAVKETLRLRVGSNATYQPAPGSFAISFIDRRANALILGGDTPTGTVRTSRAITLSIVGGLIGVLLGVGCSTLVARILKWPIVVSSASIILSFGVAGAVGIFFGFYPARKASRLDPIDALRYE